MKDKLNLLRKMTFRKLWNALLLGGSFYASRLLRRNLHRGMPMALSIEPTTACNLGCPECPSGLKKFTRPTGNLRRDTHRAIIDQVASRLWYLNLYFQGEPYINPSFFELVSYASQKGIYTATSTNGHFLSEENAKKTVLSGLDRLIISIDGTTQETYESYRVHGKLDKVIEGTQRLIRWKKELKSATPHLIFQFLVVRPNEHQVPEVFRLASELGVEEVRLKTAQVYEYKHGNPLIPENEKYSRYLRKSDGTYRLRNRMSNHCWRMWSSCVITWDGKVVPCCFDKDATHRLGDLQQTGSFREIWGSPVYNHFRQAVLRSRKDIEICSNCSEGTKVWA